MEKKQIMASKEKITTKIKCPKCGTVMDVKDIKRLIKQKIDEGFDSILENL